MHDQHERDRDALRSMLRRAAIAAVNDAGTQQLIDLLGFAGEKLRGVPRIESFGFASNPPSGGTGIIACAGGRSDRALFLGGEHPDYRPKDQPVGGVTIYDANGQAISFVRNNIRVTGGKITFETAAVTLVGTTSLTLQAPSIVLDGTVQLGSAAASVAVKLADNSAATKVTAI